MKTPPRDPNYSVANLRSFIKAKVTEAMQVAGEYAFIGSQPPEDHEAITEDFQVARYNLERTIQSVIDARDKKARQDVATLIDQLDTIEHLQDRKVVAEIAKRYQVKRTWEK